MTDYEKALTVILDPGRSEKNRLNAIHKLRPQMENQGVLSQIYKIATAESSIAIRSALLSIIVDIPITKISDRSEYIDVLYHFAIMDNEPDLRYDATRRLVALATEDQDLELLFSEILVYETTSNIRALCIDALCKTQCRNPFVVNNIVRYAKNLDADNTENFFRILSKFDDEQLDTVLLSLYSPYNSLEIKERVLAELYQKPKIAAEAYEAFVSVLLKETNEQLIHQLTQVFVAKSFNDTRIVDFILDEMDANQNSVGFVQLLNGLVAANPYATDRLKRFMQTTGSSQLKLHILKILEHGDILDVLSHAACDENATVSIKAIHALIDKFEQAPEKVTHLLIDILSRSAPLFIAEHVIDTLSMAKVFSPYNEKLFLTYFRTINDPALLAKLSKLLARIPVKKENAGEILKAYLNMLNNHVYANEIKHHILDQLIHFNIAENDEIKACLEKLMLAEPDIDNLELIHDSYKDFRDNTPDEISLLLTLFLKFCHQYPARPTDIWLSEFRQLINSNEEVKNISDYLIWMTQDKSMILAKGTESVDSSLIGTIKDALKNNRTDKAKSILDDAYNNQSISKSEIVHLFEWIMDGHVMGYHLIWHIINMLTEAKLFPAQITECALRFIEEYPSDDAGEAMTMLLRAASDASSEIKDSVASTIGQEHYDKFIHRNLIGRHGYAGGSTAYSSHWWGVYYSWPLFKLIGSGKNEFAFFKRILSTPVDEDKLENHNIHYFCLNHLVNREIDTELLTALAKFIDQLDVDLTIGSMFDRACCVYDIAYNNMYQYDRYDEMPEINLVRKQTEILVYHYLQYAEYAHRTSDFVCLPVKIDMVYLGKTLDQWGKSFKNFITPIKEKIRQEDELTAYKPSKNSNCPTMLNIKELSDESIKNFFQTAYSLPRDDEDIQFILNVLEFKYELGQDEFHFN